MTLHRFAPKLHTICPISSESKISCFYFLILKLVWVKNIWISTYELQVHRYFSENLGVCRYINEIGNPNSSKTRTIDPTRRYVQSVKKDGYMQNFNNVCQLALKLSIEETLSTQTDSYFEFSDSVSQNLTKQIQIDKVIFFL